MSDSIKAKFNPTSTVQVRFDSVSNPIVLKNQLNTTNNALYLSNTSLNTIQTQFTSNDNTTYANSVSYTDIKTAEAYSNSVANAASLYQTKGDLSANVLLLTANASIYLGNSSGTLANISSWITGNSSTSYTNAINYASNGSNITSGTLNTARLPSAINVATSLYAGNSTIYSTINSTSINIGSNSAQFGTAAYISSNGMILNGVASISNTMFGWSKVDVGLAVNTYYKFVELPANSALTFDAVVIEGILDDSWNAYNKTQFQVMFGNRGGFTSRYYLNGPIQAKSKIISHLEANGAVSIYYATEVISASYMSAALNIKHSPSTNAVFSTNGVFGSAIVYPNPVANTTIPTGTRNFDTSNSSYIPLLSIPYSGVPSYSGQNIVLANTTTFAGTASTANNATYLGGFTWTSPGSIGSVTANAGAFTTLTTTQGSISNTVSATPGQVIAYANMQGGRVWYGYDLNGYAALYESRFINAAASNNIPNGMYGNFYWYGMGAGDTTSRGFDLLGTSSDQFWFRERGANNWNRLITANTAHTLNGVISFNANASFSGNATSQILIGSTSINATTYSGTANNATYLGGQAASYYTNATNLATGTVPTARLGTDTANSSTVLYGNNVWALPPASSAGGSNNRVVTINSTVSSSDDFILAVGPVTITLLSASTGKRVNIQRTANSTGLVTILPNGSDTIGNQPNLVIQFARSLVGLQPNTTDWIKF